MAKAGNRQKGTTVPIKNRAAACGLALAAAALSFGQKQAFAVWYSNGTAGLYRRAEVPSAGDAFDGRTVTKVETGIEDKEGLFKDDSGLTSVTAVDEGIRPKTTRDWFFGCANLEEADLDKLDTSKVTDMSGMFGGKYVDATISYTFDACNSLTTLHVSGWDTSSVTDMSGMFWGCSGLSSLDVSGFDTSSVTDMSGMFESCSSLTTLDVSGWDTSSVTKAMGSMFSGCSSLD